MNVALPTGAIAPGLLPLALQQAAAVAPQPPFELLPEAAPLEPAPATPDDGSSDEILIVVADNPVAELLRLMESLPLLAAPPPVAAALPSEPEAASPAPTMEAAAAPAVEVAARALPAETNAAAPLPVQPVITPPLPFRLEAAPTPTPPAAVPAAALPPLALDDPDWSHSLGERVSWATDAGLSEATIDLHPEELGPIRIRIETQDHQASVSFLAAHAATRELLSQSLPQLRELLNGQGLTMGRQQVAAMPGSRDSEPRTPQAPQRGPTGGRRRSWRLGLVDDYV